MVHAEITVAGERLLLHPHRAIHWKRLNWVIVSDLHLGKAAHFRKAGIALPEGHDTATLDRLDGLVRAFSPDRVLILGDLFHSSHNGNWDLFQGWSLGQRTRLVLVRGNHDVLDERRYADAGLVVVRDALVEGPFTFCHDPLERPGSYVIGGHIHPGLVLRGPGRQHVRMPCFVFGRHVGMVPSLGTGTGLHLVRPDASQRVFGIAGHTVVEVSAAFA